MAQTSTTTSMPAWAEPYGQGYLQRAQQVADSPYQAYQGPTVAGFNPWQTQALTAQATRAADGSPVMGAAQGALQGMMGGQSQQATMNPYGSVTPGSNPYAGAANPYLTQQIDQAQGDVIRGWNQVQMPGFDRAMSASGSFGNANIGSMASQGASDLQKNLGQISGDMRFRDYTQQQQLAESGLNRGMQAQQFNATMGNDWASRNDSMFNSGQNRILSALGMAPSFAAQDYADIDRLNSAGAAYQQMDQRGLDDQYRRFQEARQYPQAQLDIMGNALGRSFGSQTTNTTPDPSRTSQAVGGAVTGAALWNMLFGGP